MSGGHFNYIQYKIEGAANAIERILNSDEVYAEDTREKFKLAVDTLFKAAKMLQRVDWLVCGDEGEASFHERWKEELENDNT